MKKLKKVASVLMVAAVAASCIGCGQKAATETKAPETTTPAAATADKTGGDESTEAASKAAETEAKAEPVTLRFAWWGAQERNEKTMEIIELYKTVAPHVTIEPEMSGWGDYFSKLATQAGGSSLPDVIQICDPYTAQYASKGQLADMEPLLQYLDTSGIEDSVLEIGRIDGKLVNLPVGLNAYTLIYDTEAYEKAGAKLPSMDWTWEDFEESARKIAEATGQYGASYFEPQLAFPQYLNSYGLELYGEDGKSLGYTDDNLLKDYFEMNLRMQEDGIIPGPDLYAQRTTWEESFFVAHEAPSMWQHVNNMEAIANLIPDSKIDAGFPPCTEKGTAEASQLRIAMSFAIGNNSQHKEEAMKFIDFFINNVEVNKILQAERGIPISSKVREEMQPSLNEAQKSMFDYVDIVAANCKMQPVVPESASKVDALLKEINEKVLYKMITPEEGAKEFRSGAEAVLNE